MAKTMKRHRKRTASEKDVLRLSYTYKSCATSASFRVLEPKEPLSRGSRYGDVNQQYNDVFY